MRRKSTKGAHRAPSSIERRDLYQEVTDKIVAALEKGVAPWVRPWRKLGAQGDLRNAATDRPYSGVNVMLLSLAMDVGGYDDPRWLTFRQTLKLGGSVRKGEKGTLVVLWKPIEVCAANADGKKRTKTVPVLRHYTVFNVRQCDGLDLPPNGFDLLPEPQRDKTCEAFLKSTGADIRHGGSEALYRRRPHEYVQLPQPKAFADMGAYYATAFHELVHWTGDEARCARTFGKRFGDDAYALEELVAEIGSAFCCRRFQVDGTLRHPEYLHSWLTVLKSDRHAITRAASMARKACEHLAALTDLDHCTDSADPQSAGPDI